MDQQDLPKSLVYSYSPYSQILQKKVSLRSIHAAMVAALVRRCGRLENPERTSHLANSVLVVKNRNKEDFGRRHKQR